jgi:hypothetical protein
MLGVRVFCTPSLGKSDIGTELFSCLPPVKEVMPTERNQQIR